MIIFLVFSIPLFVVCFSVFILTLNGAQVVFIDFGNSCPGASPTDKAAEERQLHCLFGDAAEGY